MAERDKFVPLLQSLLLLVPIIAVAAIFVFWIPMFTRAYSDLGVPLPLLTQMSIELSLSIFHYWYLLALSAIVVVAMPFVLPPPGRMIYTVLVLLGGTLLSAFGVFAVRLPVMNADPPEKMVWDYLWRQKYATSEAERSYRKILTAVRKSPESFRDAYENGCLLVPPEFLVHFLGESQDKTLVPFLERKLEEQTKALAEHEPSDYWYGRTASLVGHLIVALHRLDGQVRVAPLKQLFTMSNPDLDAAAMVLALQGQPLGVEILAELEKFDRLRILTDWKATAGMDQAVSWQEWWNREREIRKLSSLEVLRLMPQFVGSNYSPALSEAQKQESDNLKKLLQQVQER